jgi:hypothetical protein
MLYLNERRSVKNPILHTGNLKSKRKRVALLEEGEKSFAPSCSHRESARQTFTHGFDRALVGRANSVSKRLASDFFLAFLGRSKRTFLGCTPKKSGVRHPESGRRKS